MFVQHLLPAGLWLGFGILLLPACAPLSPSGAAADHWPVHGNQYYNYRDAKYLGSDSAGDLSYRLIDSLTFADIVKTGARDDPAIIRHLINASQPVTIDFTRIQADLQWVKDSSAATGREYQAYLFIDRSTGIISSVHGEPGTSHNSHPYIESDRNHGVVSPIPANGPRNSNRILIGQVHGHPALAGAVVAHRMSPDDSLTAVALQAPIYAIDAMDGVQGTPGPIHRANPNPRGGNGQDLFIGRTWGLAGSGTANLLNIGLNALHIWGISHQPDFDVLSKIDSANAAIPNTLASTRH